MHDLRRRPRHHDFCGLRLCHLVLDGVGGAARLFRLAALSKLPPKQAAAIVLRHYHGYTNRAIAQALGIPERTVASRLAVAKERLRVMLKHSYGPEAAVEASGQPGLVAAAD